MYGQNNVADGWAGAVNTHPHPTPHPTPFPTETPAQKGSKTLVFRFSTRAHVWTDRPMDGPTDRLTNQQKDGPTDGPMDGRLDKAS